MAREASTLRDRGQLPGWLLFAPITFRINSKHVAMSRLGIYCCVLCCLYPGWLLFCLDIRISLRLCIRFVVVSLFFHPHQRPQQLLQFVVFWPVSSPLFQLIIAYFSLFQSLMSSPTASRLIVVWFVWSSLAFILPCGGVKPARHPARSFVEVAAVIMTAMAVKLTPPTPPYVAKVFVGVLVEFVRVLAAICRLPIMVGDGECVVHIDTGSNYSRIKAVAGDLDVGRPING